MNLTKVKYLGIHTQSGPENVSNWMGN
jgi:hypothetical protein